MKTYRITITLAPLSDLECHRALDAINQYWRRPEQLSRKPWQGAFILSATAEAEMSVLETERLFGKRIASAIWRRLGRYVRVTVDFTGIDADNNSLLEFDESNYREAMSIR